MIDMNEDVDMEAIGIHLTIASVMAGKALARTVNKKESEEFFIVLWKHLKTKYAEDKVDKVFTEHLLILNDILD